MKFLLLHYFDESELDFSAESSSADQDEADAEERELADWVDRDGGHRRQAATAAGCARRARR